MPDDRLAPLPPIERVQRLSDRVAELLESRITDFGLRPGDRLPSERELGEQLNVSRTVVREAVRLLVARGLVEVRSGTGVRVAAADGAHAAESLSLYLWVDAIDFAGVHEVRTTLETAIAGIAAREVDKDAVARLRSLHRKLSASRPGAEAARLDLAFHLEIAEATGNPLFPLLLKSLGDGPLRIRQQNIAVGSLESTLEGHGRILDRIAGRDADGAEAAMRDHLDDVESWWSRAASGSNRAAAPSAPTA